MWIAVCSNPHCRWDHPAYGKVSALVYADGHHVERYRDGTHRVHIVNIPEDPPAAVRWPSPARQDTLPFGK